MSGHLIVPKKSAVERLSEALSPQVKAALITGAITVALTIVPLIAYFQENSRLRQENAQKNVKIQELQTELAPFKAFAIEKFSSSDAAAMRKLAEHLASVDADLKRATTDLHQLRAKAEIPALRSRFHSSEWQAGVFRFRITQFSIEYRVRIFEPFVEEPFSSI